MRKILINKPGEFTNKNKYSYSRSAAVKMLANIFRNPDNQEENKVIVFDRASMKTSQ
jgi:hypothetical protein